MSEELFSLEDELDESNYLPYGDPKTARDAIDDLAGETVTDAEEGWKRSRRRHEETET